MPAVATDEPDGPFTLAEREEAERNLRAVRAICACLDAHDLPGADELLAPGAVIRTTSLFADAKTPAECGSFVERFGGLTRRANWNMRTTSVEQLDARRFVVTAAMEILTTQWGRGYAAVTGSVWHCRDGRMVSLVGFTTAAEARAYAASLSSGPPVR